MRNPRFLEILLLMLLAPGGLAASRTSPQERAVVSKEVAVSRDDAALVLEFADEGRLDVRFREGRILLDGESLGAYTPGGPLEEAWRGLLGQVVVLPEDQLGRALVDWAPPAGLDPESLSLADQLDRALEAALLPPAPAAVENLPKAGPADAAGAASLGEVQRFLKLLQSGEEAWTFSRALEGLDLDRLRISLGEDLVVESGETVEGTVLVIDGDLEVHGTLDGDAVVVDGSARTHDGSLVTGDLRLVDARLYREGGVVEGRVRALDPEGMASELEERIRDDVEAQLRVDLLDSHAPGRRSGWNPFRNIAQGFGGLMQNLISFAFLSLVGLGMLYFIPDRMEAVGERVRKSPGRSAVVGLAGAFLAMPVFILGILVLAVSIVGIPLILAWLPLFPLAVMAAGAVGFGAVAVTLGRWLARYEIRGLEWIQRESDFSTLLGGLVALMFPFAAGNVIHMTGLDFLEVLFTAAGVLAGVAAASMGLGAVLLTRFGRTSGSPGGGEGEFDFGVPLWETSRPRRRAWETPGGSPEDETSPPEDSSGGESHGGPNPPGPGHEPERPADGPGNQVSDDDEEDEDGHADEGDGKDR